MLKISRPKDKHSDRPVVPNGLNVGSTQGMSLRQAAGRACASLRRRSGRPVQSAENNYMTPKWLLIIALFVSSCAITGCLESSFNLAGDSRLPRWITLPPGLTRTEVTVTLNYYTKPGGNDAKFILKDRKGKKLAEVRGQVKNSEPLRLKNPPPGFDSGYPTYEVIVAHGITEIVEHRRMEPIFYVTDDPAVREQLLALPQN